MIYKLERKMNIFIIDDEKSILESIKLFIDKDKYNIYTFKNSKDLLNHKSLLEADLFIIDIRLKEESGIKLSLDLQNLGLGVPRLFISGFSQEEFFKQLSKDKHEYIYDFISKPFNSISFLNRIGILLKISAYQKYMHNDQDKSESILWNLFINNSKFFVISINQNFKIKACSSNLIKTLEYKTNEVIGQKWSKFIDSNFEKYIYDFRKKSDKTKYCEVMGNIIKNNGVNISIKWFISIIDNNELFSIGTLLTQEIHQKDNSESIRSYFKNILERDSLMIQSIKQEMIAVL